MLDQIKTEKQETKILYLKPKSHITKIIIKIFPKKFNILKEKIIVVKIKLEIFLFIWAKSIFLRFKYPSFFFLPSTQIRAIDTLLMFSKILKTKKINFFLNGGSLLGAYRHESFAGRPSDVDLGIKEDQFDKLLELKDLLIKNGAARIQAIPSHKFEKLQISIYKNLIDFSVFRKKEINGVKTWICGEDKLAVYNTSGEKSKLLHFTSESMSLPFYDLENLSHVKLYGKPFLAPANPALYLKKKFGKTWVKIDKKQFVWKKINFNEK